MKQLLTQAIILTRTNYGEADRIITLLTLDYGKLRLMAKGVRRIKSKLAGGIELFSISQISFIKGRGELGTLVSARLITHYGNIIKNIDRVQLGYLLIKMLHKATEDEIEPDYFSLLEQSFQVLNDDLIGLTLIEIWFRAQLLRLSGQRPNLQHDIDNNQLDVKKSYAFNIDNMAFVIQPDGQFRAEHIKLLRLIFNGQQPKSLQRIQNINGLVSDFAPLVRSMSETYIRH